MKDISVIIVLMVIITLAVRYVYRARKKGGKCIGCPGGCSGGCSHHTSIKADKVCDNYDTHK